MRKYTWLAMAVAGMAFAAQAETGKPAAEIDAVVGVAEGVPGGVVVSTMEIKAKVVAIDYKAREAGLLMPGGSVVTLAVGPEAVNFSQIKKGDLVKAVVTEELVVRMGAPGSELNDGETAVVIPAAPGSEPGAIVADTIQVTAVVVSLDGLARTAGLLFEDGTVKTVAVRDDIDLTQHRLGERVVFELSQMVAISVEKQVPQKTEGEGDE